GAERGEAAERVGRALERLAADMLDDDVDAALARPPLGLLDEILRAVVDDVLGAEPARELDLVVAADGRHHPRADQPRDLDGRAADTAARRRHLHELGVPTVLVGAEVAVAQADRALAAQTELARAAREPGKDHDALAPRAAADALAERLDRARHLAAVDVRQPFGRRKAAI